MFKKLSSFFSCVLILLSSLFLCNMPVSAAEITPYYLYTHTASSTLTISGTTATCVSTARGYSGETTKIFIYQALQKKNSNNSWTVVSSWSETDTGYIGSATNTKSSLASGTYRLRTVFTVYAGSAYETIESISSEKTI